ncbi:MAG: zinc-ribbon domain-containing protein [Clostridiales bacterium]|nr:zinc-ribbon domain-containing protein [Clostridiales bacterium]
MPYCKKCGAELPEFAVFCSKCGVKYPVSAAPEDEPEVQQTQESTVTATSAPQQPMQPTAAEKPAQQQPKQPAAPTPAPTQNGTQKPKSSGNFKGWFKNNYLPLYVILGVVSVLLLDLTSTVANNTFGLGVTFGIFAILTSIAFCAVGVGKYFVCGSLNENKKHSAADKIFLALGIIIFVYVFISSIVVLKYASDAIEQEEMFKKLFLMGM